jgi:hypothetical protein
LVGQNIITGKADPIRIQLFPEQTVVFCDYDMASQVGLHQHKGNKHLTYLPYFYKTIGTIILQPYLELQPNLSKEWGTSEKNYFENPILGTAARKWNEALISTFNSLKKAGGDPLELNGFPFYLGERRSAMRTILRESVKKILPRKTRLMLGERLQKL